MPPPAAQPGPLDLSGPPLGLSPSRELIRTRPSVPPPAGAAPSEGLFQVDINQQGLNETVMLLRTAAGRFLVAADDLDRWRLRVPSAVPLRHEGKAYYPLDALPGVKVDVDERRQTLAITTHAEAFATTVEVIRPPTYPAPSLTSAGGFLNYSLSVTEAGRERTENGVFEAGFFSRFGVLTNDILAQDLGDTASWLRLQTTFSIDYPDRLSALRLGDGVVRPGAWGRAPRFGGVQYSTNFATQPGFIRTPVQATAGTATLPSTVDVFVNNALTRSTTVPPGPFSITNIPIVSGSGQVRVVVRDILGREQVISEPFYGSVQLLQAGLSDFSYEAGLTRRDFGLYSNHYGPPLGAATYRRGFTNYLTEEVRGEYSDGVGAIGSSTALRAGNFGILSATYALSQGNQGAGHLIGAGVEHSTPTLSYSALSQWTTEDFRQVGMASDELPRRRQTSLSAGYQFGTLGNVSVTHITQEYRDRPRSDILTAGYSVPVSRWALLAVNALKVYGDTGSTTIGASLVVPLGQLTSASAGVERRRAADGATERTNTLFLQKSLPLGEGFGYRVQTRNDDVLAGIAMQTRIGTYTAEANHTGIDDQTAVRFGATGGVGMLGGHAFLSGNITDSFAVVRVADYPGVRVLQDNQPMVSTNRSGYAVLPRLRAYDRNQISIDSRDLPFDAAVGALKVDAVPYSRSGVFVDFPVRRVRAAVLTVTLEDGAPIPSGAVARLVDKPGEFPIALRGELYIEGLEATNRIAVSWKGQHCTLEVAYPRTDDPLPNLGSFLAKE
jgi:outer membrane usher protein